MGVDAQIAATWEEIGSLTPWDQNPRHNATAVDSVAASIERFGFGSPIIARESDRVVIAGHTRLQAAQKLGLDKVPVRFLDLDPAQARALALADNRIGEIAEWDDDMLSRVLSELNEEIDIDGLGWSDDEIQALLDDVPDLGTSDPEPDTSGDDEIPDRPPALTKPGDIVEIGRHRLYCGDCIEVMRSLDECSVDAIVTDPPYGIGFMGKGWDSAVPSEEWAAECLRVLKPGGHLIAFAACRTVHRLAVAVEDAGFEIRDQIAWLQWQGFPKSLDVSKAIDAFHGAERKVININSNLTGRTRPIGNPVRFTGEISDNSITAPATKEAKQWAGWGTALKPSQEPAILARKPLEGTVAENVLKWGVGGLNIDGCRMAYGDPAWPGPGEKPTDEAGTHRNGHGFKLTSKNDIRINGAHDLGRWPANIFHCPKPSRGEREEGCESLPVSSRAQAVNRQEGSAGMQSPRAGAGRTSGEVRNIHPTVKPIALMRWLVRLVTPPGATVLETFTGSGTTMLAAEREGVTCLGIEREPAYCDIIRARLSAAISTGEE